MVCVDRVEDDRALWQRWRDGDQHAGRELYLRHSAVVSRVLAGKLPGSIDDLVQATFLRALESARRDREVDSVRGYLVATARNLLLDTFREAVGPRGRIDPMTHTLGDLEGSLSGAVAGARDRQALLVALRRIPLDSQLLLELFYWEKMTGDELAVALGVPVGTVRSRLRRARDALRSQMGDLSAEDLASLSRRPDFSAWAEALREPPGES